MNRRVTLLLTLAGLLVAFGLTARAQEDTDGKLSVDEIVSRSNRVAYYQGKDGRAQVSMVITDKQGRKRKRRLTILRRDDEPPEEEADEYGEDQYTGDQKLYVYFHLPADVRKTVFLVWKHAGVDAHDDRWLYMPGLDLVKRIASTEERTSFVGSHFFYEDVSGRSPDEDEHELIETTDDYYVLDNTPKTPDTVEFAHYKVWIHRATFLMVKAEYYDAQGEKYREYQAMAVETIQDYPTVTRAEMRDLRTGGKTVLTYSKVQYNIDLPEDIFTERYLRRAPTEHLR